VGVRREHWLADRALFVLLCLDLDGLSSILEAKEAKGFFDSQDFKL
jgi:hypothetical protein